MGGLLADFKTMRLQLLRNATMRLTYAGVAILTDPYLGARHAYTSLAGREQNPTVDLPCSIEAAVAGVDLVIISHLHNDHFDPAAVAALDKAIPMLCQPGDEARIGAKGFNNVVPLIDAELWQGISITRTGGTHGTGKWGEDLNPVSGFVFKAPGEPTVYWVGDTVYYDLVQQAIEAHHPDVIIPHCGGAELEDSGPIIMDAAQTVTLAQANPAARLVAIHMEALDHCLTSRVDLRAAADRAGIDAARLLIPADGDIVALA